MELKRIIARDSRSANEKAIQLYGPDVLIISSQRVDQQTELIVAVDVASEAALADTAAQQAQPTVTFNNPSDDLAFKADKDQSLPFAEVFQNANAQAVSVPEPEAADTGDFQTAQAGLMARAVAAERQAPSAAALQEAALAQAAQAAHYEQQRSQEIVAMLSEKGINIARRTVAKYREAMRIPSSVERRRLIKEAC